MIGKRLQRARKAAGLTLRDLADMVGLSHAAIKKYEDELTIPNSATLIKLAEALHTRTEYFFRPESIEWEGLEYRKRGSLSKKRLAAIEHEVMDQIERRIELEGLFPDPPFQIFAAVRGLPKKISNLAQIEDVAEQVRDSWALGYAPIPELIDVLETRGIRVFMIDEHADAKFDGLAASVKGMPVIVIGANWPGDRQRFTMAHELGHLMLAGRLADRVDEELACNRFAGAFLLPRQSALEEFGQRRSIIELNELALLKQAFGLSMGSLLHRARDLNIVKPSWYEEQARFFRTHGWHNIEPGVAYPVERPHVFEQLVFHALAEDYIGESKAAELMNMSRSAFRKIRMLEGSHAAYQ